MAHKMQFFLMTLVVLNVVLLTQQASVSPQALSRAERSTSTDTQEEKCENDLPCAWAIYTPFTRVIRTIMTNTCVCPKPLQCIRDEDDLATYAYVYRCREASNRIACTKCAA